MRWLIVIFSGTGLILVDRWLKILARHGTVHDFGFVEFILFKNDALVFSWPAPNGVAIWLMIVALIIIGFVARRMVQRKNIIGSIGSLFILLGALSNLFDRLTYGYVIDWAYLGRWWPVFNLADVMIGVGLVLIIRLNKNLHYNVGQ